MRIINFAAAAAVAGLIAVPANAQTLQEVKDRGNLNCGINTGLVGFAFTDENGSWQGFDVALCQAVAAAIFDDPEAVEYTSLTGKTRFTALASGEVDLLSRNTTWTLSRDVDLKLDFQGVNYYDGQGFMVPKALGVTSALELDGATICIQTGTTTELNLADYFRANDMNYEPVPIETDNEAQQKYLAEACDAYTTDASGLAAVRSSFENPSEHVILPQIVSKEPLGPVTRHGDSEWSDVVRWTLNALIIAEEKGITKENVEEMASKPVEELDPEVARLLGVDGGYGEMMGLPSDWAVKAIAATGNYAELFDEFLGPDTAVGLERGLNALYSDGGILYAPPFR
ncbi:amino acid ABC transporter substrate-binding protein [Acuticoccus sp. MNP-M23]|uniref:amino acid ABC transporter substrate-binding protein n=1 Tax=Acuticoccus sp. MNP-M23 TaxID=3072793 RepID=UPI0028160886|nr:amino acid ABC transporter substrate-binding protein [Acuticoccus sp. MNP-M23]WMS45154.1 amino acid ABC transporter substrate-binding protein [Acuticoccus sp. MNP-M23]